MAYDPKDPADKKIVDDAVAAALATAEEEHQSEVERLNNKNKDLLGKLAKARKDNGGENTEEIANLERELETTKSELATANSKLRTVERDLTKVTGERDTLQTERDTAVTQRNDEFRNNALTSALAEVNVAPHFMDAAKALLAGKLTVEVDGDNRSVKADGKDVGEFVKEWSASDAGKHYILAPANGGGGATGANGGGSPTGLKKLSEYSEAERADMARNRPEEWKQVLAAAGQPENGVPTPVIA